MRAVYTQPGEPGAQKVESRNSGQRCTLAGMARRVSAIPCAVWGALLALGAVSAGCLPQAASAQSRGQASGAPRQAATRTALRAEPLDINTATEAELRALPGMGVAFARRVLEGRPYTAKNQLLTRGVLPQDTYGRMRDQIVAHRVRGN